MFLAEDNLRNELEGTLDRLICHAKILASCDKALCEAEALLLQKMQESLLAKFMHMQEYMEEIPEDDKLPQKIRTLHEIAPDLFANFSKQLAKNPSLRSRPSIGRNRKRSKTRKLAYCVF